MIVLEFFGYDGWECILINNFKFVSRKLTIYYHNYEQEISKELDYEEIKTLYKQIKEAIINNDKIFTLDREYSKYVY